MTLNLLSPTNDDDGERGDNPNCEDADFCAQADFHQDDSFLGWYIYNIYNWLSGCSESRQNG